MMRPRRNAKPSANGNGNGIAGGDGGSGGDRGRATTVRHRRKSNNKENVNAYYEQNSNRNYPASKNGIEDDDDDEVTYQRERRDSYENGFDDDEEDYYPEDDDYVDNPSNYPTPITNSTATTGSGVGVGVGVGDDGVGVTGGLGGDSSFPLFEYLTCQNMILFILLLSGTVLIIYAKYSSPQPLVGGTAIGNIPVPNTNGNSNQDSASSSVPSPTSQPTPPPTTASPSPASASSELIYKTSVLYLKQLAARCDGGRKFVTTEELEHYLKKDKKLPLSEVEFTRGFWDARVKLVEEKYASPVTEYLEGRRDKLVEGEEADIVRRPEGGWGVVGLGDEEIVFYTEEVISFGCRMRKVGRWVAGWAWGHGEALVVGNAVASLVVLMKWKFIKHYRPDKYFE